MTRNRQYRLFSKERSFLFGDSYQSLVDLLRDRAQQSPQKTAFTFLKDGEVEVGHLSYQALDEQARSIASHLQNLEARKIFSTDSQSCAILLYPAQSVLDFIPAFFGCLYANKIAVPSYPPRKHRQWLEFQRRVKECNIDIVLTTSDLKDRLCKQWEQQEISSSLQSHCWIATDQCDECDEPAAAAWHPPSLNRNSIAYLQHTSGSTGIPKGVMITHGNLLHNSELIRQSFKHDSNLHGLIWLPFNHDMGLVGGIIQPIYVGGRSIFMTSTAFVQKPIRWLKAISRYRITTSGGPNFAYDLLCQRVSATQRRHLDLSSWTVAFCGAEPVRTKTLETFSTHFSSCGFRRRAFYPCYGMAETTLLISGGEKSSPPVIQYVQEQPLREGHVVIAHKEKRGVRSLIGCGHSWLENRIRIVNSETRQPCPANEVGEIWVQGPGVGKGYWQQPDATEQTFQAYLSDVDEGPFLRTGDLGFLYHDELFITGRLKEVIKFWGGGVYPQQLEETLETLFPNLLTHSSAAFSVELAGAERVVIAQELDRHTYHNRTPQQVKTMVKRIRCALLTRHFIDVYAIAFLKPGGLPKTTSGKIQRRICAQQFLAEELPAIEQWTCPPGKEFNYARWSGWAMALDKFNLLSKVRDV